MAGGMITAFSPEAKTNPTGGYQKEIHIRNNYSFLRPLTSP